MAGEFFSHIPGVRHIWQGTSHRDVSMNGGVQEVQVPEGYRILDPRVVRHLTADNRSNWKKGLGELGIPQELTGYYVGMEVTPVGGLPQNREMKAIAQMRSFWEKARYALQCAPTPELMVRPQAGFRIHAVSNRSGAVMMWEGVRTQKKIATNAEGKRIMPTQRSRQPLQGEPYAEAFGLLVNVRPGESEEAKRMRERCKDLRIAVSAADARMWCAAIDGTARLDNDYYALLRAQTEARSGRISYTDIMNAAGQLAGTGIESIRPLMRPLIETRVAMARAKTGEWTDIWNTADNLAMALRAYEQALRAA